MRYSIMIDSTHVIFLKVLKKLKALAQEKLRLEQKKK